MQILRVDLARKKFTYEDLAGKEAMILGGRALIADRLAKEVDPTCDPLGPSNKLIFTCGPLAATGVSSGGRLSVGGKSPLTGGIKEANAGGIAADSMAKLGLRAVILEETVSEGLWVIKLDQEKAEFINAEDYRGLGNFELAEKLFESYGNDYALITIGQAGEQGLYASGISVTDVFGRQSRLAARGGLGAVMGAKGVKAILVNKKGAYRLPNFKQEKFIQTRKNFNDIVKNSERTQVLKKYGTASTVMAVQKLGALPTRNFSRGQFEQAEAISGERLYDLIQERGGKGRNWEPCMGGCLIQCSNVLPDANGEEIVAPLEYETICLLGSNLGVGELDAIGRLNYLCNDLGVDTIEVGGALGVMAEAGLVSFGDSNEFAKIIQEIAEGTMRGRLAGMGTGLCGKILGVKRVPAVKNQGMSAYDPRGVKGTGVTYATSPMGADHTAGLTVFMPMDHHSRDQQAEVSRKMQIQRTMYDALGLCAFLTSATGQRPDALADVLNALYDTGFTPEDLNQIALEVIRTELEFNQRAGLGPESYRIPKYFIEESLPPFGLRWDVEDEELDALFD